MLATRKEMRGARATRRSGLQRGVQRGTIGHLQNRSQATHEDVSLSTITTCVDKPWWRTTLEKIACRCFELTFFACSQLCLTQVVQDPYTKQYKVAPFGRRCVNLVIWVILGANMVRNLCVCIERLAVSMDLVTLACLTGFWGQVTGMGVGYGVLAQPKKTAQLLNTWSSISKHEETTAISSRLDLLWESPIVCMQTVVASTGQILFPLMYSLIGLVLPSVPIFALPSIQDAGLVPQHVRNSSWYWVWWAALYPLDIIVLGIALLPLALSGHIFSVEVGLLKAFLDGMQ